MAEMCPRSPEVVLSFCKGAMLSPVQSWLDLPEVPLRPLPVGRGGEEGGRGEGEGGRWKKKEEEVAIVVVVVTALALTVALTVAVAAVSLSLPLVACPAHLLRQSQVR